MDEREKMLNGELYKPFCDELRVDRMRAKKLCMQYNQLTPFQEEEKKELLISLLGKYGKDSVIEPNFFCDYGYNIEFDGFVYVNHNSVFLDCAKIKIGDNTLIGPNCGVYTAMHPINPEERDTGLEYARPITIGKSVWIGGGVTILAGVNIGDGAVIGAGSVVTRDVPPRVVAYGNPCKIVKNIE